MKKFFQRLHVKFVQWLAVFYLRHADKAIRHLLQHRLDQLDGLVNVALNLTTELVRCHMISLGKDPDITQPPYQPDLAARHPVSDTERFQEAEAWENGVPEGERPHWIVDTKQRPQLKPFSSMSDNYTKHPENHPILRSRAAYQAKQQETVEVNINVTMDPPTPTEIATIVDAATIDMLREAVFAVENTLELSEDKKPE